MFVLECSSFLSPNFLLFSLNFNVHVDGSINQFKWYIMLIKLLIYKYLRFIISLTDKVLIVSFSFRLLRHFFAEYFNKDTNVNKTLKQFYSLNASKITFWEYDSIYMH